MLSFYPAEKIRQPKNKKIMKKYFTCVSSLYTLDKTLIKFFFKIFLFCVDLFSALNYIHYMMNNKIFSKRSYMMKKTTTNAALIAKTAKNAPVVAELENAPKMHAKKNLSRADLLASSALTFDDIAVNDDILFNDATHASAKHVEKMFKRAVIIERSKNEILASVSDAIYIFRRSDVSAFTFAKIAENVPAPVTFANVKLTIKNLVNHADVCKNFLSSPIVARFTSENVNALSVAREKFALKNAK